MRNLHPLEPQGIRANVPAPDGAMQSGHSVDFLSTTSDMHKAQAGTGGSGAGEGGLAQEGVVMDQDEIIAMAREVGFSLVDLTERCGVRIVESKDDDQWAQLERFAALAAAKEREACAEIAEAEAGAAAHYITNRIRARGAA